MWDNTGDKMQMYRLCNRRPATWPAVIFLLLLLSITLKIQLSTINEDKTADGIGDTPKLTLRKPLTDKFADGLHGVSSEDIFMPISEVVSGDKVIKYQKGWTIQDDPGLLSYIRQQWIHGPSTEPYNLKETNDDLSQMGQSALVDKILGQKKAGFFVECGAANGHSFSNTLFFEKQRQWTGLLVEANPFYYSELLGVRRKTYSINACLSVKNQTDRLNFKPVGLFGGLEKNMDETHLRFVNKQASARMTVLAQCFPAYSILLSLGKTHVDYFSLDVEGPELEILQTLPLDKLHVEVFSVEYRLSDNVHINETGSLHKLSMLRNFFKGTGLYEEAGITPWGSHDNPEAVESKGLDVMFKRKKTL